MREGDCVDHSSRRLPLLERWICAVAFVPLVLPAFAADVPEAVPLWFGGEPERKAGAEVGKPEAPRPGFSSVTNVHNSPVIPYLPPAENAAGSSWCGTGHRNLAIGREGYNVGEWLAGQGVAAFVVKYRQAREPGSSCPVGREALAGTSQGLRFRSFSARRASQ